MNVLKNFASINSNIVISPGNDITTISEAKNVLAQAKVSEEFSQGFGIYDLNEFLNVVGLVDGPRLRFENEYVLVGDASGRAQIKYYFSDTEMLTTPSKLITMPSTDVSFFLDQGTLNNLKRAASVLGHSQLVIEPSEGAVKLSVVDIENSTSNGYAIDVDGEYEEEKFKFVLNITNLKMIAGDYNVSISSKLISEFKSTDNDLTYWVALEKSSTYGE